MSGEWRVESGEWRVESEEWRVKSGQRRILGAGKRRMTWLHVFNDRADVDKMLNASIQSLTTIH